MSKTETGKFTFVLKAGNGETILRSQTYQSKAAAEGGIASVQKNCGEDDRYEKKESSDGKHYFNLLAANKQVIGTSQMYKTVATRDEGIEAVKKDGKTTTIKSDV
ncbi:MAG TPA: YegP family protein [Planctomycetia bacterium]|nr:YegP family protein [Planctomycetia bacterium]